MTNKTNATELILIVDRSGSMAGLEKDTIGGFNSMLEKQRETEGICRVSTVLFDTRTELLHDRVELEAIRPLDGKSYRVGGGTALLDAVGMAMEKMTRLRSSIDAAYRPEHVLFVIITDGEENSSRTYTYPQVKRMIENAKAEFGWEFIFLGANIDAAEGAASIGISQDRSADFIADHAGVKMQFSCISDCVTSFRKGSSCDAPLETLRQHSRKRDRK